MSETMLRQAGSPGSGPQYLDVFSKSGTKWINSPPIIDSSSESNRQKAVDEFVAGLPADQDCEAIKGIARAMKGTGGRVFEYIYQGPVALIQVSSDGGLMILNLVANPDTRGGGTTMIEYVLNELSPGGAIGASRIADDAIGFYDRLGFKITGVDGVLDAAKSDRWANVGGKWCYTKPVPVQRATIGALNAANAGRVRASSVDS
jgi:hypothetical protein